MTMRECTHRYSERADQNLAVLSPAYSRYDEAKVRAVV